MSNSFRLFRVRGIDIRIHITFPLILIWAALSFGVFNGQGLEGATFGIVVMLMLFAIIVLHELGHSVAAQNFGVSVKEIILLPIGGVAQLERIPENPFQEFVIAIAGPLVNFVIAVIMILVAPLLGLEIGAFTLENLSSNLGEFTLPSVFGYVFVSNIFIGVFNLLPAFPMDGGRVLRALLATKLEYSRATAIAVVVGRAFAWLLGLWGFLSGSFFAILIAFFIYSGAGQEGRFVQLRSILGDMIVEQAYTRKAQVLAPTTKLKEAVQLTLTSFQANFAVCDGDRLVGLMTYPKLVEALDRLSVDRPVSEVMLTDFISVSPEDKLFDTQQRMMEQKLEAVPVAKQGRYLGLITSQDIGEAYRLLSLYPGQTLPTAAV
ncbi:MAG: site-2 protease family protein [Verrucomicrobia bacterium]|nr:site-2 protease family protein [Verrucomicrobiota bacterium]